MEAAGYGWADNGRCRRTGIGFGLNLTIIRIKGIIIIIVGIGSEGRLASTVKERTKRSHECERGTQECVRHG
jgi:hypothetical protein